MKPVINFPDNLKALINFEIMFDHKSQYVFKFPNSYGLSVLWWDAGYDVGSYGFDQGLWEVAVLKWQGEGKFTIDTEYGGSGDGVYGSFTVEQVLELIETLMKKSEDSST